MAGAQTPPVLAVEVFKIEQIVAPVWITLKLLRRSISRPPALIVSEKNPSQPALQFDAHHTTGDALGAAESLVVGGLRSLRDLLDVVEYVLVLAIDPGWGGQAFIPGTVARIGRVQELIARSGRAIAVGVDGGVTMANVVDLAGLGLDVIVTGSAVFDGRAAEPNGRRMLDLVAGLGPRAA